MAFQPIDLQVNVMQASNVAESVAHERDEPRRAKSERSQKWVEERQSEENTSEETADQDENESVNEDETSNIPNRQSAVEEASQEEQDDQDSSSSNNNSEPDKGTHLDLTT